MDQFNKLVTWINNNSNNNFTINEHDTSSILKNAWLRPRKFKINLGKSMLEQLKLQILNTVFKKKIIYNRDKLRF